MADRDIRSDRNRLLEQMTAIARLGDQALRTDDLQTLLQESAALVATGLGVKRAMVLELEPDGRSLLMRAGAGWPADLIGALKLGADRGSPAGHALKTGAPAISEDLTAETRFETPDLLRRHAVKSVAAVAIEGSDGPFGVFEIDSDVRRRFTEEDVAALQGHASLLAVAIDRLRTRQALAVARDETTALLRELQHRVKNNLQMITSIVRIQKTLSRNPEAQRNFETLMNRLTALSLVHKQIHVEDETRRVALNGYLEELCSNLVAGANPGAQEISLDLRLERVSVPVDVASSLGLIVNEFVTNSLQHAFPDRRGTVAIGLEPVGSDEARLLLADNGIGRPQPETEPNLRSGLGLQLIKSLTEQVGGRIAWDGGASPGTRATVTFPV